MKKLALFLCLALLLTGFTGCSLGKTGITALQLPQIPTIDNMDAYIAEVRAATGGYYDGPLADGIVNSPYFKLKVNGEDVDVYATRTTFTAHSFACIDVAEDDFTLEIDLTVLMEDKESVTVLPEKHQVETTFENGHVTCTINKTGTFSFVFDERLAQPLTLIVRKASPFTPPEGYTVKKLAPGTHTREETELVSENQVLYFEKGLHYVHHIQLQSNSIVYFETGAYLIGIMPTEEETPILNPDWAGKKRWKSFLLAEDSNNVKILGHGVLDFTPYDWHARSPINIERCYNVEIDGPMLVNGTEWSLTCALSSGIRVRDVVIFGYRQNCDGICMRDSYDCVIENCFARSGDDLFEVKGCSGPDEIIANGTPEGAPTVGNVTYRGCDAWPDKTRAMGVIHETYRDITGCTWEDCTVAFAPATWRDQLGSLIVLLANDYAKTALSPTISDIHFNNIEIYDAGFYPMNVTFYDGVSQGTIKDIYFNNIRFNGFSEIRNANYSKYGTFGDIYFDNIYREGEKITDMAGLNLRQLNATDEKIHLNELSK